MTTASGYAQRTAVLYARVSSDEQEKEGFSIPAQKKLLEEYAAREGFRVLKEYVDVETAKTPGRRGFNDMVDFFGKRAQLRDGKQRCRILLVEKTDRLYRNLKDYITIDELDVDVHFVKEGVVVSPDSHSSEKFMHGIKVLMAKNYVDNLGEEVKKGMREKAEQGIWPAKAPMGYRNVEGSSGKKIIELDPETSPIVRRMFERYATGRHSMKEVGEMALAEGLEMKREGNIAAGIQYVLKNPIYAGWFKWKGRRYEGIHTPLVTKELWDKVQERREERRTRKRRRVKRDFAFGRMISCGHCGCTLVGEIKKGKYVYYRCTHYKTDCNEPYVREEVLEEKFTDILRMLRFDEEVLDWIRTALQESHDDTSRYHREVIDKLQKDYKRLEQRLEAMYVDKLDGKVGERFYEQKSAEWREEQSDILCRLEEHQNASQSYMEEGISLMELANRAADLFEAQSPSEKRRLLDFVLSNSYWADGELTPEFRQPFDMIADMATVSATEKAAGLLSGDLCQVELPESD
jgi:DNA invertase Pin-like site-specific DNA recombinase